MKPIPLRPRQLVQTDLFDAAAAPAPLTSLQGLREELIELLSQLLWQVVASPVEVAQPTEEDDEQDQP